MSEHSTEKVTLARALRDAMKAEYGDPLPEEMTELGSLRRISATLRGWHEQEVAAAKAEALREAADVIERQTCLRETNCHKADAITLRERALSLPSEEPS